MPRRIKHGRHAKRKRGKSRSCKKPDGLRSRVRRRKIKKDSAGRYINYDSCCQANVLDINGDLFVPYCDFHRHKGIAIRPNVCEIRECRNYHILPISSDIELGDRVYIGEPLYRDNRR